ncbi:MAG: toprim domain-containing protein [Actinomycetota bacterium]|nr:toprim domain-containing protein [Actinomycetota bacterium]
MARHSIKRVLIAYDPDDAGSSAATSVAAELTTTGTECFRIVFPKRKDANDIVREANWPRDALGKLVRSATWPGKGRAPLLKFTPPVAKTEPEAPAASSLAAESPAPIESPVPHFVHRG